MSAAHPFTVLEAEVRLYTVDSAGEALDEQWLGACVNALPLEGDYRERAVQYHGRSRAVAYHEDESWKVTLENVRVIDLRSDPPRPLRLRRNVEYAMVIVWRDTDADLWLKRCYTGVKAQPGNLAADNIAQTLRFTAEEMSEAAGGGTVPDFSLIRTGEVWYVDGSERTLLYTYDPAGPVFTAPDDDLLAGRAEINLSVPGTMTITIGGDTALFADATGVEVGEVIAIGGTYLDTSPRLEFWSGTRRCASLDTASLATPNVSEASAPPATGSRLDAHNPAWLFSLTPARAYAPAFSERA